MDREEALKLLRGGEEGIEEWNKRRAADEELPALDGADFSNVSLVRADFSNAELSGANLSGARIALRFAGTNFQRANLSHAILNGANFTQVDFTGANLSGAQLDGSDFSGANLRGANLLDCSVDGETELRGAVVEETEIDRYTLECLVDYGGLTKGDRMNMRIRDGVARLRSSYSGFWQWIHILALLIFLFPYGWFVISRWSSAQFSATDPSWIPLWEATGRYILNSGTAWEKGWNPSWWFALFLFALLYNLLRGVLLWKTKQLELQEESSGLPPLFSLEKSWVGKAFLIANVAFWLNLLFVLLHSWHFLDQKVPVQ